MTYQAAFETLAKEAAALLPDESPDMALARIRGTLAGIRATSDRDRHGYFIDAAAAESFARAHNWEYFTLWCSPRGWQAEEVTK